MSARRPTITCIGELLWDVLPSGRNLGGAPANVAYHLSRLGLPVRIVTRVGRDELGEAARDALHGRGLPVTDLQWDEALPTGAAHVELDAAGHASYRFVTPAAWDALEAPDYAPEAVVFGSLAQRDARSAATVRQFVRRAPVRVFDVNLRPPFTPAGIVADSLPLATLVKLNDDEARQLAGTLGLPTALPQFAAALAARHGHEAVCITRGPDGAGLWIAGAWFETPGLAIQPVDTVGSGDAFLAALLSSWLAGEAPPAMLERANRLGAFVATRKGAMPDHEPPAPSRARPDFFHGDTGYTRHLVRGGRPGRENRLSARPQKSNESGRSMNSTARATLVAAIQQYFAIPQEQAALVLDELEPCVCRGGDWLFRQGDAADCLYLLARGRMQVWLDASAGTNDAPRLVAEVEPGETIGEIGMLTGGTRSAGVRAVRNSLLLRMTSAAYDRLARQRPELTRHIAGGIAGRLRDRTAGISKIRRTLKTIALVSLGRVEAAEDLAHQLSKALASHGTSCVITARTLRDGSAPDLPAHAGAELSPAMVDWLAMREDEHRFVFYVADPADAVFTDVALHHADLILQVAQSGDDAKLRPWERSAFDEEKGPVARRALVLCHSAGSGEIKGTGAWLARRELDFHLHVRADVPNDLQRVARVLAGTAVGLVLGGGAARGFAHIGVYRAMHEAGVPIDWLGGASIGAVMAAGMATGLDPAIVTDRARVAFVNGRPFGDVTLPIVSFLRGRRMEQLIGEQLPGMIEDLPLPFFCVSSNLGRGTVLVHDRGAIALALRASVSLPGIFPPAVIDNQFAVDGGILDNLPVDLMRGRPVGRIVAVDLSSQKDYRVNYDAVPSPWRVLAGRFLPFTRRYRVPGTVSVMLMAMSIGAISSARSAGARADLLIRPPVGDFSFTDVRAFDQIVEAGYQAARTALLPTNDKS